MVNENNTMPGSSTIWVISELYYPEETSTGHAMTWIAETLARQFTVKVVCAKPTYASRGRPTPKFEIRNNVEIRRCTSTTFNKDRLFLRVINIATISMSIFLTTLRKIEKGDIVIVVTNPPLLPYIAILACLLRKARCLVRVDDTYPDILVASGAIGGNSFASRLLDGVVTFFFARAEGVIVLGRDMQDLWLRKVKNIGSRIWFLTNWADDTEIRPAPKNENALLRELGLQNKFIVQCAGNIGRVQGIETIFQASRKLRAYEDIHFLFIGSGAKKQWLLEQMEKNGSKNITVIGNRPRSDQANFLNACDIAATSLIPGMLGISVPSRTYNILAAGKPIVAVVDQSSEIALTVKEEKVGWVVPPEDSDEMANIILKAKSSPQLLQDMGKRARSIAETKYSRERILNAYVALMKKLTQ